MKYYRIRKGNEHPNSALWYNLAFGAMRDLEDLDPDWQTWYSEHIASDETQEAIYDKVKERIVELRAIAATVAAARRAEEYKDEHPRPEWSF